MNDFDDDCDDCMLDHTVERGRRAAEDDAFADLVKQTWTQPEIDALRRMGGFGG